MTIKKIFLNDKGKNQPPFDLKHLEIYYRDSEGELHLIRKRLDITLRSGDDLKVCIKYEDLWNNG